MSSAADHIPENEMSGNSDEEIEAVREKKLTGPVEHHEIGEMAHFLKAFGRNKDEVVKTLMASSLQIVGLDEVKREYEGRWEKIEHRVNQAVDAFFTKKLRKQDTFVHLEEGRFALIFANMSREEGLARAMELSRELINILFGEMPGIELISVEAMVLDVDVIGAIDGLNSLEEVIHYFQEAIQEAEEREEQQFKEAQSELTIMFRSVLNHRKQLISVSEVVPARRTGNHVEMLADNDPIFSGSPRLRSELDLLLLKEAGSVMETLGSPGNKPIILITVAFETLANAYCRKNYSEIMKDLPEYTRRHLVLNVEGVAKGIPNSRYRQILTPLTPTILGFSFEVEKDWDCFHAISDLPVIALTASSNDPKDLPWIQRQFFKAKENGIKCAWRGLSDDSLARYAFKIEVDYVSGSVISTSQEGPVRPFSLKRS